MLDSISFSKQDIIDTTRIQSGNHVLAKKTSELKLINTRIDVYYIMVKQKANILQIHSAHSTHYMYIIADTLRLIPYSLIYTNVNVLPPSAFTLEFNYHDPILTITLRLLLIVFYHGLNFDPTVTIQQNSFQPLLMKILLQYNNTKALLRLSIN